jgi:hypothetical protein
MIFNENDQLNELNLLPIWDVRAPSMLESKLPDCSDNFYIVTTLELNAKKMFFIYDLDHNDKQSQKLMRSINQFLKTLGVHKVRKDEALLNLSGHNDAVKIILSDKSYDDPSLIKLPSIRSMCENSELKKKLWNTIKENFKL